MISFSLIFLITVSLSGVYLIFIWKWRKNRQSFYCNDKPFLFAHRGSPCCITENTILSFKTAIEQGADGLEFDIRLTRDNKIIIFHDSDLIRMAERTEKINETTYSKLKEYKLKKTKGQKETAHIPLLEEVVPLLNEIKAINIEIKSDALLKGANILNPLIQFLDLYQIDNKCIVSSFNPLLLWKLKSKRPKTIIGFLYYRNIICHSWCNLIWIILCRPDNLHIHFDLLDHWIVGWAQRKGLKINSYTINDKKTFEKAKKNNIDGVFTDNMEYIK